MAAALGIAFSGHASAVIQVGIDKLLDVLKTRYSSKDALEQEIRRLWRLMITISKFLHDFSGSNDKGMQLWLRELIDIAFRAERFIDELHFIFVTGSIGRQPKNMIGMVDDLLTTDDMRHKDMTSEISKFINSSQEVLKEWSDLNEFFQRDITIRRFGRTMAQTSTYVLDPHVFGREDEKRGILEVVSSNSKNWNLSVIPILGITGIGKTTLARYVFTDPVIDRSFVIKSWISMGVEFDLKETTRMMLQSITGQICNISSLNKLQEMLHEVLKGRKFLMVLDGVWNENQDDWNTLLGPLRMALPFHTGTGSVVLLTTQSPRVASTFGTTTILKLQNLSLEDCRSIFWKHACRSEESCQDQELQDISSEIIKRCRGIPVLAKTFGNLLWMKTEKIEWKIILDTDICHLPETEVLAGLRLTYSMLPAHLQTYITYCAIFPRGFKFEKYTMIQLWMAEELLKPNGRARMEDIGSLCFDELVDRSFFEQIGETHFYTINWLMYDMIQLVAGDDAFRALVDLSSNESPPYNESLVRYLLVVYSDKSQELKRFVKFKNLRFFSLLFTKINLAHSLPDDLLESMKFIRVLDLMSSGITELPTSIGKLKFLRYFNLSGTQISEICDELCDLVMLQTLKLRGCLKLSVLPSKFGNLYNMRALEIEAKASFLPPRIGNLTMLQELKLFDVRKKVGHTLCELQNLVELRETLCILGLENVSSINEACGASLRNKEHLSRLELQWGQRQVQFENEEEILENLQPHHYLKELSIRGYLVHKLPNWEWSSPSNLVEVELVDCVNLRCIQQLNGLKSLKILRLRGNDEVEEINNDFFGLLVDNVKIAFCSLEIIHLESWTVLRSWITLHNNAFNLLNKVMIHSCPFLKTVPDFDRFNSLKSLEFESCPELRFCQGKCPKRVQRVVYKECPYLGGDLGARGSVIWPFGWKFFNNRS